MAQQTLYKEIANTISQQISSDTLRPGDKLPSLRTISRQYGVSINTAIQAYHQLEADGYIKARPKSGYLVNITPLRLTHQSTTAPAVGDEQKEERDLIGKVYYDMDDFSVVKFSLGIPDDKLLPIAKLNKELIEASRNLPGDGIRYENTQGNLRLRRNIARLAYSWHGNLSEDDIVTTLGTTNAVALALSALTQPGDTIAVESPCYFGLLQIANNRGLRVLELPTNPRTGVDIQALKGCMSKIKACILISNFNNPIGSVMPDADKQAVVEMLAEHDIPLIEDDIYGDVYFGESRPIPCKKFDTAGNVLWCGSVSKTLAPGYRVGWIAPGKYKERILREKYVSQLSVPPVTQEAIGRFLEFDRYENHLRKLRDELHANSLRFIKAIEDSFPAHTKIECPQGGFMLWVELDKRIDTAKLYDLAMSKGISIAPGRMFTLQNQYHNCMRLSYGQLWNDRIEQSLHTLGILAKSLIKEK